MGSGDIDELRDAVRSGELCHLQEELRVAVRFGKLCHLPGHELRASEEKLVAMEQALEQAHRDAKRVSADLEAEDKPLSCEMGHELKNVGEDICFRCGHCKVLQAKAVKFRCALGCSFEACIKCHDLAKNHAEEHNRLVQIACAKAGDLGLAMKSYLSHLGKHLSSNDTESRRLAVEAFCKLS